MTEENGAERKQEPEYVVRFSLTQRIEHIVLMITFVVLAVTGLAQRYSGAGWGEWVILHLGGIGYTRFVHRAFGVLFTLSVLYHFSYLALALVRRRLRPSMVPTLKDFRDVVGSLRYSFGLAERPPRFGRFDYRQKFEYWGMIFGGLVIIVSGYVLMYPLVVTRVLPGEVVAAARAFHGFEATLAALTIVVWHLYDVVFKPGIFPGDVSIFTGRISRRRQIEEHPLERPELAPEETPAASAPQARSLAGEPD